MEHVEEVDPGENAGGKGLGGVKRGEAVIRIYCMRKESIFIFLKSHP